jgi:DNA-binding CsgD family transcriptional regulator
MVGSDDEAPALFAAALALPGIEEWPFELARVQLAHGERLRRLRRTRDARSQLAAARDGFARLGARPWARRAATELGATGATRQRVNGGGASLTLQEREVARLAATGLTNREIAARLYVAPRTVSAHLYRIFPKLGITSRAALRDALNTMPATPRIDGRHDLRTWRRRQPDGSHMADVTARRSAHRGGVAEGSYTRSRSCRRS